MTEVIRSSMVLKNIIYNLYLKLMDSKTTKLNLQIESLKNIKHSDIILTKKENTYIDKIINENDTKQQESNFLAWEGWELDSCAEQYHSNDI